MKHAAWDLRYQDTFDHGNPRRIELSGQDLVKGLVELWARPLFETVLPNGLTGFIKFDLWWKQEWWPVLISGDGEGQVKIRQWIYGVGKWESNYLDVADQSLLTAISETHAMLIVDDLDSQTIISQALNSETRDDFITTPNSLRGSVEN